MRLRKRQQGLTALGWVLAFMVGGLIAMAGVRLVPVYIQSFSLNSIMQSVASDVDYQDTRAVNRALRRQMQVNDVRAVDVDDFQIEEIDGRRYLTLEYEHRVPYLANIDLVVSFEKQQAFRGQ
ncbi:hypothetical protein J2T60_000641 [Natronospira proteinivora]|uniref:DUF4845 domain-containing protein n=1 Tax=Natronospira proteinivora TaxID=1807133 RepID=A0ABT1G5Y6_9GAMM|nr:DUF4845 domain-containing protein [Natronospira proteinivora]MCP1726676.1 hypothetical protein [Natronospira proteinivora]